MTSSDSKQRHIVEARLIEAAADRLLAGSPQRSSGRLSVVALADESGIKRTRLYDHHRGLVDSFLERSGQSRTGTHADQTAQLRAAQAKIMELQMLVSAQEKRISSLTAVVVELTILRDPGTNLVPIRRQ